MTINMVILSNKLRTIIICYTSMLCSHMCKAMRVSPFKLAMQPFFLGLSIVRITISAFQYYVLFTHSTLTESQLDAFSILICIIATVQSSFQQT